MSRRFYTFAAVLPQIVENQWSISQEFDNVEFFRAFTISDCRIHVIKTKIIHNLCVVFTIFTQLLVNFTNNYKGMARKTLNIKFEVKTEIFS